MIPHRHRTANVWPVLFRFSFPAVFCLLTVTTLSVKPLYGDIVGPYGSSKGTHIAGLNLPIRPVEVGEW